MTKRKPGAKIGRPKGSGTGKNPLVCVRFEPAIIAQIDAAISEEEPDRSAVVRGFVIRGLRRRSKVKLE
jgi:hypothetical protein